MQLSEYVSRYQLMRHIEKSTVAQLKNAAKLLTLFAGGQLAVESLTDELVNRWLFDRRESGRSPNTVRGNRTSILMLWKAAAEEGLVPEPKKVCRIKRRERVIRAFTMQELAALSKAAREMRGTFRPCGVSRKLYWTSFLQCSYDTGLRLTDLLTIKRRDIWWPDSKGTAILMLVQQKTGHVHRAHIRPETMKAIERCLKSGETREFIWPAISRRHWYVRFKKLCKAAVVEGTSKLIRRSGASYIARDHGELAAQTYLGHRTPGLAKANYIDVTIAAANDPLPPAFTK